MSKHKTEYKPPEKQPTSISLDCGCELEVEYLDKDGKELTHKDKKKASYTVYHISYFCEEHDPSLWENYTKDDDNWR